MFNLHEIALADSTLTIGKVEPIWIGKEIYKLIHWGGSQKRQDFAMYGVIFTKVV